MILIRHGQSEFNVVFSKTRQDPGIRDPLLTDEGRRQAHEAAKALIGHDWHQLISSPYTRALQTASIVAEVLMLPIAVEPLVGERAAFACDVGTARSQLRQQWPHLDLDHLDEEWWPSLEESEEGMADHCRSFHEAMESSEHWHRTVVVTHWGFIRGTTGLTVANGTVVRLNRNGAPTVVHPRNP
jgi:broad specificity phosphatase PhoE